MDGPAPPGGEGMPPPPEPKPSQWQPGQAVPLRPRGVGELLEAAFAIYRLNWRTLIPIAAYLTIPLTLAQYLILDLLFIDPLERAVQQATTRQEAIEAATAGAWEALVASAVLGIVSGLIWLVVTAAVTRAAAGTMVGDRVDVGESYRFGFARLGSILWVSILVGLAMIAGFFVLIVGAFFVYVRLIAAIPAVVVEGKRGTGALSRSWNLVKGRGWPVFGAMVVAAILAGVVSGVLTAPAGDNVIAQGILAGIGSAITLPFVAAILVLIYLDLRVRKENLQTETLRRELQSPAA